MKARLETLVAALRRADVAVSIAEAMDAARATTRVGIERVALREALAATLVKDERDRGVFLAVFDEIFPARPADVPSVRGRRRARRGGAGGAGGAGGSGGEASASLRPLPRAAGADEAHGRAASADARSDEHRSREDDAGEETEAARAAARRAPVRSDDDTRPTAARARDDAGGSDRGHDDDVAAADATGALARLGRERRLLRLPFRDMTPADVDACADLARALAARIAARVRRRLAPRPSGRLDFRRTIRAAVPRGGVPFERRWRGRRPGPPDLVALCDLSRSTATATDFFLALLAPAATYFRRVQLFGFVDRLAEIEFVAGQVRPAAAIDLMARSDFGQVLRDLVARDDVGLGADTVLVILGDARNNRRPPRADLLAAARARVRRTLWLNPDPRERWNTGDSVIAAYARHVDAVVACGTLAELERALAVV